jgi:hypothetical protein
MEHKKEDKEKGQRTTYAGTSLSQAVKTTRSQNSVYVVFTGNSCAVKSRGKRETWAATARGR